MIRLAGSIPIWNSDVIIGRVALGNAISGFVRRF